MSLPGIQVDVENKRKDTEQDYKHDIVHRSYSNSEESTSISESMSNPQPDMTNTTIQDQTQQHQQHQHQKNRKDDDHEDQQEDHEDDHPTCAICLGPYRGRVYLSPCFHVFCASCLSAWIEINLQCPLCKSNPVSLHYGVDTALEVIHTLQVSDHNRGELITVLNEVAKDVEKRNEKSMDEDKEEQRDRDRDHQHGRKRSYDNKEEDDDDDDDYRHYDRSGSRSRSSSHERSRSRSLTPIDSSHRLEEPEGFYPYPIPQKSSNPRQSTNIIAENSVSTSTNNNHDNGNMPCIPANRNQVYKLGLEPYPPQDFSMVDQILESDMVLLDPFLERDLAVLLLMDYRNQKISPVILAHVRMLLLSAATVASSSSIDNRNPGKIDQGSKRTKHQGDGNNRNSPTGTSTLTWGQVDQELTSWIVTPAAVATTTTSATSTTRTQPRSSLFLAHIFTNEMRRFVKKRWKMSSWDRHVQYHKTDSI